MASFRIHEDQENRGKGHLRQKVSNMASQPKRSVLGVLDSQLNTQNQLRGKQQLEPVHKINDEKKTLQVKPPIPAVPVAQFEAFKVYEDVKENKVLKPGFDIKLKSEEPEDVKENCENDDIDQDKILEIKTCNATQTDQDESLREESLVESILTLHEDSPMSIERSFLLLDDSNDNENDVSAVVRARSEKDRIFEIEEYRPDIYIYLRDHELRNRPKPGYMRKQPDITYNMRTILVDWLVEVAQEYKLQTETLYLCINYLDRFLSYMSVVRGKLQLVGTAAMFIAAKYEEIYPPDIGEFVFITDDTYSKKQLLRMEQLILKVLSFDLSIPTPLTFVTAICMSTNMPLKVMHLGMYICELSMLEADMYIETRPSIMAAAAIAIARFILKLQPWNNELKHKTGYQENDLKRTMEFLYVLFCKAPSLTQQAIQEKYNCSEYMFVSQQRPPLEDRLNA